MAARLPSSALAVLLMLWVRVASTLEDLDLQKVPFLPGLRQAAGMVGDWAGRGQSASSHRRSLTPGWCWHSYLRAPRTPSASQEGRQLRPWWALNSAGSLSRASRRPTCDNRCPLSWSSRVSGLGSQVARLLPRLTGFLLDPCPVHCGHGARGGPLLGGSLRAPVL